MRCRCVESRRSRPCLLRGKCRVRGAGHSSLPRPKKNVCRELLCISFPFCLAVRSAGASGTCPARALRFSCVSAIASRSRGTRSECERRGARQRPARQASAVPACHAGASEEVSHVTNAAGNGGHQDCDHPPAQDVLLPTQEPAGVLVQALGRPASHLQEKARLQWLPQPR